MPSKPSTLKTLTGPLAADLRALGHLIRERRLECDLELLDAAEYSDVEVAELSRIEDGQPASTVSLYKMLRGLGLEMLIMQREDAGRALIAVGHSVDWHEVMQQRASNPTHRTASAPAQLLMDNETPTVFVDFDGTLHVGNAYIDDANEITLDTGRPLLEFAHLLAALLAPYPNVKIVLTTSWTRRLPVERVIAYLPPKLRTRVVGTTSGIRPRRSYVLDGTERTHVIASYAYGKRLKHWLAIDDAVFCAERFGREPGELVEHFLLLDSSKGICDRRVLSRIAKWLVTVHAARGE